MAPAPIVNVMLEGEATVAVAAKQSVVDLSFLQVKESSETPAAATFFFSNKNFVQFVHPSSPPESLTSVYWSHNFSGDSLRYIFSLKALPE